MIMILRMIRMIMMLKMIRMTMIKIKIVSMLMMMMMMIRLGGCLKCYVEDQKVHIMRYIKHTHKNFHTHK